MRISARAGRAWPATTAPAAAAPVEGGPRAASAAAVRAGNVLGPPRDAGRTRHRQLRAGASRLPLPPVPRHPAAYPERGGQLAGHHAVTVEPHREWATR